MNQTEQIRITVADVVSEDEMDVNVTFIKIHLPLWSCGQNDFAWEHGLRSKVQADP